AARHHAQSIAGQSRPAARAIPRIRTGQGRARQRPTRPRPHGRARAHFRHRHAGRQYPGRPLRRRRHAGVQHHRRPGALGRRQSEGNRHHLSACRAESDARRRQLPRPHLQGHGRFCQPRHWRAILDSAAAERHRKLGQGRAARSRTHRLRQGRGYSPSALRHECRRRYRHRAQPVAVVPVVHERTKQAVNPMNPRFAAGMSPKVLRMLVTVCAMTATIMQALDTTIANVALPYMQGSLSASLDQINWVLTSYIVAAAIMTAPIGWLADRFGRKKLFITCVTGFTVASLLCALAQNIEEMVLVRLLQGMAGAALVPLSQSTLLDSYTVEERGSAMAIWGIGVMLGPIMGPTLGAWLTDNYSWHWVFLINLPIGIATAVGMLLFMQETPRHEHLRFDWFGFIALAIGSLQLMLDRGEQVGWFGADEIWIETIVAIAGFYYFFAHSLTTPEPFV